MAHKIFVSSSYKDRDLARDLTRRLKEAGFQPTYSELTLTAGSDFEKAFMSQLKRADEMIVVVTSNSVHNPWMMFEVGAASSLRKKITPVIVGLDKYQLPQAIRQLNYIKYDKLADYIADIERQAQAA
jgi:predicted RNA-binding protein with PIN domain